MKSGIYQAAHLYLLYYLGAGHGENIVEDICKGERGINFFSLNSNSKRNKKSKHNREKKRNAQSSNFLNQESYVEETDNISGKDVEGSHPSHDSSFVNLNDHVSKKSSSYSVQVKERTPYSSMQRNKEKEKVHERMHGVVNSFVQSPEWEESGDWEGTDKSKVNISETLKDHIRFNRVFDMEIDFVDLHFFSTIQELIPENSKYHEYYEKTLKQEIPKHIDTLKRLIESCISEKEQMVILKHEINYAKTKSIETETLSEKESTFSEISRAYDIHIESYREKLKPQINDIKNKAFSVLKDSLCKENCAKYVQRYNTMLRNYISYAKKYQMETYVYFRRSINDYSVIDKMLSEAKELNIDISESANSLKLLGEDINEFSYLYSINHTLIDDAAENLESINEEKASAEIDAQKFEQNSKFLVNNYCIFEYIRELNNPIKKSYENIIKKSNALLSSIIDTFEKIATALYKSTFDEKKCNKIKTDAFKVKDEAEQIYERNENIYNKIPDDEHEKLNIYYDLIYPMNHYKDEIVSNSEFISNRCKNIYENVKKMYENQLNNIEQLENSPLKVDLYVMQIRNMNTQKTTIDDSFRTLEKYYETILELKRKMYDLMITFEKNVAKIDRLEVVKYVRALREEEMKALLEQMATKAYHLRELVSLKEKSNVHFTQMNELLNTGSYDNMEEFSLTEKVQNDIDNVYNSVYREHMNELIEEVENFVTTNKGSTVEPLHEAVEQKLQDAKETFAKLDFISDNLLTNVYNKMSAEVAYVEVIKKGIAQKQVENVHKRLKNFLDSFATVFDALQKKMKDYNYEVDAIEKYKQNISEKEEEYFNNVNVDADVPREESNVQEYTKHKQNCSRQEGEISAKIAHLREVMNNIEGQLNYYGVFEKYFTLISDQNEVSKVKALKEKIIRDNLSDKIEQYEIEFKGKTSAVENIVSNIQSLNMAIGSLKRLNGSINNCNKYNGDIALLKSKIKTLRDEVQKEITEMEGDSVVGENTTALLLTSLRDKMERINEKLNENRLNNLDTKKEGLLKFYLESKSQIHITKDQNRPQDTLNRIDEWEAIKKEVDELNDNYEIIRKNKVTLLKNNSVTYIEAMHSHIDNVVHSITRNKNEILKSVEAIEEKLNLVEQNEDYKEVRNAENEKQIEAIRGSISKLKEIINKHVRDMTHLESSSNISKINAMKKENEHHLEKINQIKGQMRDIYEKLKNISDELKEGPVKELKETSENVDKVELELEKKNIGHIVDRIIIEKDKARKGVNEMNSLKTKIENLIHKTSDKSQNELVTTSITKHLENAKGYEDLIKRNEEESILLRDNAIKLQAFVEVKKLVQQVNMNLQSAIQRNAGISKELNELKGVNDLLISTNYSSILAYIKKNFSESVRFNQLANEEFTKAEGEEKSASARFEEAEKLKGQIVKDLDYSDIDDKVNKIEGIKREILRMADSALTFWEESEKYKQLCSSYLENTKEGKKKIEYLKNKGSRGKANITDRQMEEVDDYVRKHEDAFQKVVEQVDKTKGLYESTLSYVTKMDNLFNESVMKEVKVKCKKQNDKAEQLFDQIKTVVDRIKVRVSENQGKIGELMEKDKIEKKESMQLNDMSKKSLLQIDNCMKELDTALSTIERVKENALQYFDAANKSMKSVLSIRELDTENSLDKVTAAKKNYEKNLVTVQNQLSHINMEEVNLKDIAKRITDIENDLLKMKKQYKQGLMQAINENADKRKRNFELVRREINVLVDSRKSIFIKLKLKEYDMTDDLKNYGAKMNAIHQKFTKSYNLIKTQLSNATKYSVISKEAQSLREEAEKEDEHLRKREEEAIRLLNDIKKMESSKLLNEMMNNVNAEYEGVTRDHASISQYVEDMKQIVDQLKRLNNIRECSTKLNDILSIVKKVKESKQAEYKRDAKSMYESMLALANYFLSDDAKISSGMELNPEMKSNYKTDLESEIFSVVSNTNGLLKKIEQGSNDVIKKERESERLAKEATDIYNVIKQKNEFNERLVEVKNKEKLIWEKIREALERWRQVKGITCHFEQFYTLLDNTEEIANLNKMVTVYQDKKDALKVSVFQEMDNDMKKYSNSIAQLEGVVLSGMESKEYIAELGTSNDKMGNISEKIRTIYSKVMEMNSTIDDLYKMGKSCQSQWIAQLRHAANMKTSKILIMINKQKENVEKFVQYIKNNSYSTDNYVETLKKFYDNKITFWNASENAQNADTYSLNFAEHAKESLRAIKHIKVELHSFHENSDISIVERKLENILVLHNKLSDEKREMDDLYINMSETKLMQMEQSSDVFKPVIELHERMNETNYKSLLEKQQKLKSVKDNLQHMEAELIKNGLQYTPDSVQNVKNIYGDIEAEVKTLEDVYRDYSDNNQKVEEYKKQFSILIDRTDTLMDDIEIFKKENNYNLMEENTDTIHRVNDYIENITNKLVETRREYENILENKKQNDDMLQNIFLKKRNIIELFENVKKEKESILNDLYEQERLLKIGQKLDEIKDKVTKILDKYEINEKKEMLSKNLLKKRSNIMNPISIYGLEREANEINTDFKKIKYDAKELNNLLEDTIKKKGYMEALFNQMSSHRNPSEYKSAEKHMNEASGIIHQLEIKLGGMDQLVKYSERILSEMNYKKSSIGKQKTAKDLRISERNRSEKEERARLQGMSMKNDPMKIGITHPEGSVGEGKQSELDGTKGVIHDADEHNTGSTKGGHGLEHEETALPTDQTKMSDGTRLWHNSTRRDTYDMHTGKSQDGTYEDTSSSNGVDIVLNKKFNFNNVKYAGAFILLLASVLLGAIIRKTKDDQEKDDNDEQVDDLFEIKNSMSIENEEEIVHVCFDDFDY
ncbi:hypothetical protein AK88_00929 [Plasmodium fragile]|uniref:Rh5 coiled-coil domain-containing protein n=1 Tax=Plasmodium fragile TaxID=5857 RepID=A0A0D9QTY9_PLAFR|nr:uncharacterized protein AK88_00929 [Plasmodium fragile]KJP89486.1 hypothetical protein AK88_00929 [Plasmodium fragile]